MKEHMAAQLDTGGISIEGELAAKVSVALEKNPSVMVRTLAMEFGVTELEITRTLPEAMRLEIPAADFIALWETMTEWEKVTFMAESPGAILEIRGQLPKGKIAHGMYNLMDKEFPLGGHILISEIGHIFLVSKPAFGLESHSVQFFSHSGACCFGVFLGRQENRELIPSVKEGFLRLWKQYS